LDVSVLDASARLLRLLSLLQIRRDWPGADLAERLGVTPRTLRRDVARLRELGYPVRATTGVAGGYRLAAGGKLPPLLLDDDEAVAVVIGLRTAAGGSITGIEEASLRALLKLEQVLPRRLRGQVAALHASTVPLPGPGPTVEPGTLTAVAAACRELRRLRFGYRDRAGTVTSRAVEPHRLVHTGRRWYLVARDPDRDDWRTFRLDRISAPVASESRFTPVDPPDAAAFVAHAVSAAPYRYHALVELHASAEFVAECIPPTAGVVEAVDAGTCLLSTGADTLDVLAVHLALIGADFRVLEPPELVAHVRALAERLRRSTG
jgi:predicted DNA-binding transcriptional regulator YafY